MDVLFINPINELDRYSAAKEMPPIGMLSVAAYLEAEGYEVAVLDQEVDPRDVAELVAAERPRLVGIGGTSSSRFEAFKIARAVKVASPQAVTVYGGCHATFTAHDTLNHVADMDVVVAGEGEVVTADLLLALDSGASLDRVQGISYREDQHVVQNAPAPRIENLDLLPLSARHLVDLRRYSLKLDRLGVPAAAIITSRGCPINCSFCSASVMFGRTITFRTPQHVVDEMVNLAKDHGVRGFKIFDSTFTYSRKHAEGICDELLRRGLTLPWECEIRVNTVDLPLLQKMKQAGCYLVDFGVESASDRTLKRMHKGINLRQVEQVLAWTQELGIAQKVFFTLGHIGETVAEAEQTIEFIQNNLHRIAMPAIGVGIRIYPGTEVEQFAIEQGYLEGFSWSQPFFEEKHQLLNVAPNIPVLVQPQLNFDNLLRLKQETIRIQASSPRFILQRVIHAHSREDLAKYGRFLRRLLTSPGSRK